MSKPKYDSTVARIAGNITPALIREMGQQAPESYAAEAVRIARAIVDEVKRTEPVDDPPPTTGGGS